MIRVDNISFRYDRDTPEILREINLTFAEGCHTALMGQNGSGKTTLLKHLNGLLLPTAGTVVVDGMAVTDTASLLEIRRRVGMVFQNPDCQIVGMTVEEDIAFGPGNLALPPSEIRRRVDDCMEKLGMKGLEKRAAHTLSGGEKRLLNIAGVLAMAPRYIALDEPTAHLDIQGKRRIREILRNLKNDGLGIIHISHDLQDIADADRIVVIEQGAVLLEGAPGEVFQQSDLLESAGIFLPKGWQ
jgi:biotin transport system ATP-binding protein/energy-coupling factor transport system ATP-binding protein